MSETSEFVSAIIGAIIGALTSLLVLRFNYHDLYARSISESRMNWIDNFREELSIIVAALKTGENNVLNAEKARAKLLTRLNLDTAKLGNEYNKVFADLLNSIKFGGQNAEQEETADRLIEIARKILEFEWQRVKKEAEGKQK